MASVGSPRAPRGVTWLPRTLDFLLCIASGGALALASYSSGRAEAVEAGLVALFGSVLVLLASHDLRARTIPNAVVYPAIVLALGLSSAWPDRGVVKSLEGGVVALSVMSVARTLSRGGLGGGDVKMAAFVGVVVGFPEVMLAWAVSAISGGLVATALLVTLRVGRRADLPYGPFLALGGLAALVAR